MAGLDDTITGFLHYARVGHLATASREGVPHVIPVCFACDAQNIYIALDAKPKRVAPTQLKRVRNLLQNPQVSFVVDRYDEDWSRLAYVIVHANAELLAPDAPEHTFALTILRTRYPQYGSMPLEEQPVIALRVTHTVFWRASSTG